MYETNRPRRESRSSPCEHAQKAAERRTQPCQDCGHVPEAGAIFCPLCGVPLGEPAEAAAEASPAAPEKSPTLDKQPESVEQDRVEQVHPESADEAPDEAVVVEEPASNAKFCVMCGARIGQAALKHRLLCIGPDGETSVEIPESGIVIGKANDSECVLSGDEYVSRRHARVFPSDGKLFLEDLESANGTFLGIRKPVAVEPGDEILIGKNILRIETVPE